MAVFRDGDLSPSSELGEAVHEASAEWRDKEEASEQIEASELTLDILTMLELSLDGALGKTGTGGNGNIVPDLALVETEDMELVETGGLVDIEEVFEELVSAELVLMSLNDALA